MTGDSASEAWSAEIRDYLLGRLAIGQRSASLRSPLTQQLPHPPIRRWWIFEGKRYPSINGTLASRWHQVVRAASQLERTFNPRLKLSERADGAIDWGQTLARRPFCQHAEYVVRSSAIGLDEHERAALRGWMHWIAAEWSAYAVRFGLSVPALARDQFEHFARPLAEANASPEQLRRWSHVARRSRWPLLRDLVAETLRASLEPDAVDHVPLPRDRSALFELLCLVRIAAHVAPRSEEIRWIDPELNGNKLQLKGATCWYQQSLRREAVLSTADFAEGLAEAVDVFGLRVPRVVDLTFEFDAPRRGISGIVVEAKSGSQDGNAAVPQLRIYRKARARAAGARYFVWGLVENPSVGAITEAQLDWLRRQIDDGEGDVWLFSTADSIGTVLELLGGAPR